MWSKPEQELPGFLYLGGLWAHLGLIDVARLKSLAREISVLFGPQIVFVLLYLLGLVLNQNQPLRHATWQGYGLGALIVNVEAEFHQDLIRRPGVEQNSQYVVCCGW